MGDIFRNNRQKKKRPCGAKLGQLIYLSPMTQTPPPKNRPCGATFSAARLRRAAPQEGYLGWSGLDFVPKMFSRVFFFAFLLFVFLPPAVLSLRLGWELSFPARGAAMALLFSRALFVGRFPV